jgi:hypothetical protein
LLALHPCLISEALASICNKLQKGNISYINGWHSFTFSEPLIFQRLFCALHYMGLYLLRQFFPNSTYNTILFSAKNLTAMSNFHLNARFYALPRCMSSRIAPPKKFIFP